MAGNFSITFHGDSEVKARVRGVRGLRDEARKLARDAGIAAEAAMVANAPRGKLAKDEGKRLADSIERRGPIFRPGGAGGGGYWQVEVGVPESHPYARFVIHGTGEAGPRHRRVNATQKTGNLFKIPVIRFKSRDMDFSKPGNPLLSKPRSGPYLYTRSHKGQEPQTDWIRRGEEAASNYVRFYSHRMFENNSRFMGHGNLG